MEENNQLDDLFRSAIESFEMEPSARATDLFEAELAKKRQARIRRRRLGYFSTSVILLFLSYTAFKYFGTEQAGISEKIIPVEIPVQQKQPVADTKTNPSQSPDEKRTEQSAVPVSDQNNSNKAVSHSPAKDLSPTTVASVNSSTVKLPVIADEKRTSPATSEKERSVSASIITSTQTTVRHKPKNIPASVQKADNESDQAESILPTASIAEKTLSAETTVSTPVSTEQPVNNESQLKENKAAQSSLNNSGKLSNEKPAQSEVTKETPAENVIDVPGEKTSANEVKNDPVKDISLSVALPVSPSYSDNKQNDAGSSANNSLMNNPSSSAQENQPVETKSGGNPKTGVDTENKQVAESKQQENNPPTNTSSPVENATSGNPQTTPASNSSLLKRVLSRLSAEIYFSPDEANSRLKPNYSYNGTASRNPDDYADPKTQFSYSTGLNVGYDLGKNWSVLSGVAFSTFSQTAVYNTIQVIADAEYKEQHGHGHHGHGHGGNHNPPNPNNDHHYVIHTPCGVIDLHNEPPHPHGQPHPENGESINIKTEVSETIHFFYVPLLVRYQFGKSKLSYMVEGGGALNFVSKDKINVVVNDAYSESNNLDGLNSMNYSLLVGAGVKYTFYKGLSTFLKPSFRYSVSPINQDNPIYSYPYYFGLGAGFTIHF